MPDFHAKSNPTTNRSFRMPGWFRRGDTFFNPRPDLALPPLPLRPSGRRLDAATVFAWWPAQLAEAAGRHLARMLDASEGMRAAAAA